MKKKIYDDQYIIITGAAGFIGTNVVRHLNERGLTNLILVDDLKHSIKWHNLVGLKFQEFVSRYDLFDFLEGRQSDIEAFIHLGACSSTVETDGDYFMENNYRYSIELAEYAIEHGHRFIYASSAATYGDGSSGFLDDHALLDDLRPLNLYGLSKHMFDLWLLRNHLIDQVVGLKYFNIFGPFESHKERMASMVYHMHNQIKKEGVVRLFKSSEPEKYADGEQVRDFLCSKDAAQMTCSFLENDLCGIYNVGSGQTNSWNDLANAVFKALGKEPKIEYIPMPKDLVGKYQNYTCADMSKWKGKNHAMLLDDGVKYAIETV